MCDLGLGTPLVRSKPSGVPRARHTQRAVCAPALLAHVQPRKGPFPASLESLSFRSGAPHLTFPNVAGLSPFGY